MMDPPSYAYNHVISHPFEQMMAAMALMWVPTKRPPPEPWATLPGTNKERLPGVVAVAESSSSTAPMTVLLKLLQCRQKFRFDLQ